MRPLVNKWILSLLLLVSFSALAEVARVGDNTALIVIDMQPYFVERGGNQNEPENVRKVNEILANQVQMIQAAKQSGTPIVFVEYEGYGDTNSVLREAAAGYDNIKFITKNTDGMFDPYNNKRDELGEYLRSKEVGNLIITGANGGACVEQSIAGALENNYNVQAYNNGIADFNYKDFIFPYTYNGMFDKPRCENCSFKEYPQYEPLALQMSTKVPKAQGANVNSSDRTIPRADVPASQSGQKPKKKPAGATAQ